MAQSQEEEGPAQSSSYEAEQITIKGSIFIVTNGRDNIRLGLVSVNALPKDEWDSFLQKHNSRPAPWLVSHAPDGNITKTDADGKFTFRLKKGEQYVLLASTNRLVYSKREFYNWIVPIETEHGDQVILSNDNLHNESVASVNNNYFTGKINRSGQSSDFELPDDKKNSIVIVEGKGGRGTGFVGKLRDVLFVFTNHHVIVGSDSINLVTMSGKKLAYGDVFAAADHDIVMFRLLESENSIPYLEFESNVFENVKIGTPIVIPGNSLGAGTILTATGNIVSVGPRLVEHNAPTFSGNSGSPIILKDSLKVIGIDTLSRKTSGNWADEYSFNKSNSKITTSVRLFGYRVDSIQKWTSVNLQMLYGQYQDIQKLIKELDIRADPITSRMISDVDKQINRYDYSAAEKSSLKNKREFIIRSYYTSRKEHARRKAEVAFTYFRDDFELLGELYEKMGNGESIKRSRSTDPFSAGGGNF